MASFIDSGVWIAAFNSKDQYHKEGSKIIEALTENGIKDAHISDYIFNEVVIYIRKKIGCKESIETANSLLNS
jgi:predicted nucleic acid-binding protein